ncbi:MAG TPA: hypothetical protein VKP30_12245, partial [Polyangiaceae bacterium]|nr:hypothetical protein [Polyangiaceae bacterium]
WEHITNPAETLGYLLRMLSPGGRLIVASPRYDFPFYIPPSARHYTSYEQVMLTLWLTWKRLQAIWCEDARFLIHLDPAVLRSPWYRDADAVHWVSRWDIRRALPPGYGARWLQPQCRANIRQRLFFEFMLLFVEVSRTPTGASKLQESEPWQSDPRSTPRSSSVIPYA